MSAAESDAEEESGGDGWEASERRAGFHLAGALSKTISAGDLGTGT